MCIPLRKALQVARSLRRMRRMRPRTVRTIQRNGNSIVRAQVRARPWQASPCCECGSQCAPRAVSVSVQGLQTLRQHAVMPPAILGGPTGNAVMCAPLICVCHSHELAPRVPGPTTAPHAANPHPSAAESAAVAAAMAAAASSAPPHAGLKKPAVPAWMREALQKRQAEKAAETQREAAAAAVEVSHAAEVASSAQARQRSGGRSGSRRVWQRCSTS